MQEKTTVTNTSVSESEEQDLNKTGVKNNSVSGSEKDDNRGLDEVRGEYERKTQVLSDKLTEANDRIAELEEQVSLSLKEREELDELKDERTEIRKALRTNPKYKPYVDEIDEVASKTKHELSLEQVDYFIEQKSEILQMDEKELRKEINTILKSGKYRDFSPFQRARLAYKDFKEILDLRKERAETKKKLEEFNSHSETGGRVPREESIDELRKKGDTIGRARKLGLFNNK